MLGSQIYKKITDFVGNKIINVRTNKPTHKEDVSNKEYVDDSHIFETEKSKKYKIPFLFKWMGDVNKRTNIQLFDELLFGSIPPEFIDADLIKSNITINTLTNTVNTLANNDATFNYDIELNDRTKVISKRLISKISGQNDVIISVNDGVLSGSIKFDLTSQTQVIFEVIYSPFKTKKTTTDVDYTPPNNANKTVQYVVYSSTKETKTELINASKMLKVYPIKVLYSSKTKVLNNAIMDKFRTAKSLSELTDMIPLTDSLLHTVAKGTYYYENDVIFIIEKNQHYMLEADLMGVKTDTYNQTIALCALGVLAENTIEGVDYLLLGTSIKTKENRSLFSLKI